MNSPSVTTGTQSPQEHDSKRAPGAPQQNDNDRKDAQPREGKADEGDKPQQK
ncbi:hypothetical protein [Stenotrophomonas nitritireducens]|uniref:hypothetical protein n=1 Tax=Stenotrophomonas nitritireducens TaxID=83617 RepID=UPI003D953A2E